jgi:hypothetical protein
MHTPVEDALIQSRGTLPSRRRWMMAALSAMAGLAGCTGIPVKMSAGPLPPGIVVESVIVQATLLPAKAEVEVRGASQVSPQQAAEGQRLIQQFADRVRREFETQFAADARAAGLPLRSTSQPGMTLTLRANRASAIYVMPGAPGYSPNGSNFSAQISYQATLTDAAGKELWWCKTFMFSSPTIESLPAERHLSFQNLTSKILTALRKDGVIPGQKPAPQ